MVAAFRGSKFSSRLYGLELCKDKKLIVRVVKAHQYSLVLCKKLTQVIILVFEWIEHV